MSERQEKSDMVEKISSRLVDYLLKHEVIENTQDDKEYYQYGMEITVSSVLNVILILIIGILFKSFIESLFFLLLFIPIRQYAGGFHASSYFKCNLTFCIAFTALLVLYHLTNELLTSYFAILITYSSILLIIFRCPIENPNKPISPKRKKYHKIMAVTLGAIYGTTGIALTVFSNKYDALILYTLLLVAVLILIALKNEERCKKYENCKKGK